MDWGDLHDDYGFGLWLFTSEAAVASAARPALLVAASAMPLAGAVFLFDGILMSTNSLDRKSVV